MRNPLGPRHFFAVADRILKSRAPSSLKFIWALTSSFRPLFNKITMSKRVTIFDPPEQDHSKALIENVLDLTPVVDLGPVRHPSSITKRVILTNLSLSLGCLYQYPPAMASPRSSRHLRRCRDRTVPISSHADGPGRLRRPQHALLLRTRGRFRNPNSIPRRARTRREKLRDPNRAGATTGATDLHHHAELQPGRQWR